MIARSTIRRLDFQTLEARQLLAVGDQFYVSTLGNNANSGTSPAEAWGTLQHAADRVTVGETIHVLPGRYQGFQLSESGTADDPIVFQAQPGVIIDRVNSSTADGINLELVSHVVIDGFTLSSPHNGTRAGIRVVGDGFVSPNGFSQGVVLRNNTAQNWGRWGIFTAFTDDLVVERNTLTGSIVEHGLYVSNSGDRPVIRHNTIFDNHANGIHMNGDVNTGNLSLPDVDGVIHGAIVSGNRIYGNGRGGGSAINGDGVVNARIENNVVYDNHASGISLYQIDGGAASTGGVIVNNTIVNASDARWVINLRNGATDTTVFNNILYNLNGSTVRGAIAALEGSEVGLVSDFNFIDPRFSLVDGGAAIDLATWQASTGNDLNSQAMDTAGIDEVLRNRAAGDYALAEDSRARDVAVATLNGSPAPAVDFAGNLRPDGGGYDVGAYESKPPGQRASIASFSHGTWRVGRWDGDQLHPEGWASWPASSSWQDVLQGDVDGDGRTDVVARRGNGEWWVGISDGDTFQTSVWGQWSPHVRWRDVATADVNGDGQADIVGRVGGKWWVARSNGSTFVNEPWGSWSARARWRDVRVGDVDGDLRDDIVGRANGNWWVARSNGTAFENELWGRWSGNGWEHVRLGDFNGDGRDDIAGQLRGRWWVAISNGAQFTNQRWGRWSTQLEWQDVLVGDFDGDGRDDLAARSKGRWWVSRSLGDRFLNERWGSWSAKATWLDVLVADVDGDGRQDILGRNTHSWWVARSSGQSFFNEDVGRWPISTDAVTLAGYFTD